MLKTVNITLASNKPNFVRVGLSLIMENGGSRELPKLY